MSFIEIVSLSPEAERVSVDDYMVEFSSRKRVIDAILKNTGIADDQLIMTIGEIKSQLPSGHHFLVGSSLQDDDVLIYERFRKPYGFTLVTQTKSGNPQVHFDEFDFVSISMFRELLCSKRFWAARKASPATVRQSQTPRRDVHQIDSPGQPF